MREAGTAAADAPATPAERRARLGASLAGEGLDALLVTSRANVRYLSGFSGSAGTLLVEPDGTALLVTDGRYDRQARAEAGEGTGVEIVSGPPLAAARERAAARGAGRVGFEGEHVSFAAAEAWAGDDGLEMVATAGRVEALRAVKSPAEVAAIARAAAIADAALEELLDALHLGIGEREAAARLDLALAVRDSEGLAFETIVAFGERAALPHARPGSRRLAAGELVLIDFGAVVDGYRSDLTRTVAFGDPGSAAREAYDLVLRAQTAAIEGIRPGMTGREADALARDVLDAAGYGEAFPHSLGHGIGLEIHERPRLSKRSDDPIPIGAVITIEPGVYLDGIGVRIEDDAVIESNGPRLLTAAPKDRLRVLG